MDASDADSVAALVREHGGTHVMNAVDPRFVMPIFDGAYAAGADYLDMAMSLSQPDVGAAVRQGRPDARRRAVRRAPSSGSRPAGWPWSGSGWSRGCPTCSPGTRPTSCSAEIDELGTRDGSNLTVDGYDFAPSFSIWTTIEECLNPPVIWEAGRGWYVTEPFSEPETFDFPGGIGPVECVNVEHEEVILMPRWVEAKRVTFKYGLGAEFIEVLHTLRKLGLDKTAPVPVRGTPAGGGTAAKVLVSPRDLVAACLPDPAFLGDKMHGATCAGVWVTGTGKDGAPARGVPLPRGRQRRRPCASTAPSAWSGRPRSTRWSPWSC